MRKEERIESPVASVDDFLKKVGRKEDEDEEEDDDDLTTATMERKLWQRKQKLKKDESELERQLDEEERRMRERQYRVAEFVKAEARREADKFADVAKKMQSEAAEQRRRRKRVEAELDRRRSKLRRMEGMLRARTEGLSSRSEVKVKDQMALERRMEEEQEPERKPIASVADIEARALAEQSKRGLSVRKGQADWEEVTSSSPPEGSTPQRRLEIHMLDADTGQSQTQREAAMHALFMRGFE